jgi:hypothetical protein
MAISVDTVYKTVLLILNKEQRGYMTPDEFNKIGSQVQREIFEAYFEDLNQQLRAPQSDMDYANRVAITDEKIAEFKTENNPTGTNPFTVPSELYRLGSFTYEPAGGIPVEIQRTTRGEYYNINKSPLTTPSTSFPIYLYEDNKVIVYPNTINTAADVKMQYLKKPTDVRWGYYAGNLGQLIHDTTVFGANLLNTGTGTLTSSITTNPTDFTNGTYTGKPGITAGYTTSGSGTGLDITITVVGNAATIVTINTAGTGFEIGDTITISNSVLGGVGGNLVITLTAANFNSGSTYGTTNFELHNSERTEVILKMLLYQGVVIRDPQIVQVAAQKVQQEEVNEKS